MRKAELNDVLLPFGRWIGQLVREKMDRIVRRGYDQPGGSYMVFFLSSIQSFSQVIYPGQMSD